MSIFISMVESIKVLCPIFDEMEIMTLILEHFAISGQNAIFRFAIETKNNDFIEAVHQT